MILKKYKKSIIFLFDGFSILAAYLVAAFLRFDFKNPFFYLQEKYSCLFFFLTIYLIVFLLFKTYNRLWSISGLKDYLDVVSANIIAFLFLFFINLFYEERFSLSIMFIAAVFILISSLSIRIFFRVFRRLRNHNRKDNKNIIIVGAGEAAALLIKEINCNPNLKYNIIGLIDDDLYKINRLVSGYRILGSLEMIDEIVLKYPVEEIIIAIPSASHEKRKEIIEKLKDTKLKLKTMPSIHEIIENKNPFQIREVDIADLLGRKEVKLNNELIASYITNKVVLITGAGGSIGGELSRQIAELNPKKLILIDNYENGIFEIKVELEKMKNLDLEVLIATVRDYNKINYLFQKYKPNTVFHAAAHKHVPLMEKSPEEAIKNNVFGTYNVAKAALKNKTEKFVLISTDKAVKPTSMMGATKRLCEMIMQMFNEEKGTDFVAVRFGNVLGSNGSVIPIFQKQIKEGGPVTVTDKRVTRYFMTIQEAVQLILQAGAYAKGGEIFILDMGQPVKIYDLAINLIKLSGLEPHKDVKIEITGLRPGEKLYEELLLEEENLKETDNKLIFITKNNNFNKDSLKESINDLEKLVFTNNINHDDIKKAIKKIVKTYREE